MVRREWRDGEPFFKESDWNPTEHPWLGSVSAGMMGLRAVPIMKEPLPTEFVSIEVPGTVSSELNVLVALWNFTWQCGGAGGSWRTWGLRDDMENFPEPLRTVLLRCDGKVSVRFLPTGVSSLQLAPYSALYQLLPLPTLRAFGLPARGRHTWPPSPHPDHDLEVAGINASTLRSRLEHALAYHVWPLLCRQSGLQAFSGNDPIRLLAFNLDFWLPYLDRVAEERMRFFGKAEKYRKPYDRRMAAKMRRQLPPDMNVEPPLYHADAWRGEEEAWQATREMVEAADQGGKLRSIVDAVRSHRVEDDFSDKWSWAREDFERKLYSKRSKCRVSFVQLSDTIPVHGPDKEVDANLLWDDLLALVDPKDRRVIVCLRSGLTRVSEIAEHLGYANHSAVSKKLARIREQAKKLLT